MPSVEFSDSYRIASFGYPTNYVRIDYTEVEYDIANNRTKVRLDGVYIKYTGGTANSRCFGTLKFNGTTVLTMDGSPYVVSVGTSYSYVPNSGNGSAVWVQHNSDGTGSFPITLADGTRNDDNDKVFGALYYYGSGYPVIGVRTPETKTATLTTRPRGSSISSCTATVETTGTFSLSVSRNSSAFYHKATITYGGRTLYTSGAFATSLSETIPRSWLSYWTNVTSITPTVSVQTYTNSACTTAVGSAVTRTFTVNADAGMKPSVSTGWVTLSAYNTGTPVAAAGAPISGYYVKGYSKAQAVFDSSHIDLSDTAGATITSYSITCNGETADASPYLTPVLESTSASVVCTVTDSRGRSASETITLSILDYAVPALSGIRVFRCDNLGNEDEDGTYFSAKAVLAFASLNSQNVCPLYAKFKAAGGSYGSATSLTSGTASVIGTISADVTYTVRIYATDSLGNTAEYFATVPTRKWTMHFRPNGSGVAFGKAAEYDNTFEISSDWNVIMPGGGGGGGGGGSGIAVQDTEPSGSELVWVDTADPGEQHIIPEIDDSATSEEDTWSSQKISDEISSSWRLTLLWTNTGSLDSFLPQTIPLDLTGYDYVMILPATVSRYSPITICPINEEGRLHNVDGYIEFRPFVVSLTGIAFSNAVYITQYGTSNTATANQYLVPVKIWGIKDR